MVWPFQSARDRLDQKAADWVSKMRGPESERHRDAFERWSRSSPAAAAAFDEAMAGFEEAGVLRQGELGRARQLPERKDKTVPVRYAFGAVAAAAVLALIFLVSAYRPSPTPAGDSVVEYATAGTTREIELPDGSRMVLAPQTVAIVAFSRDERRITLEEGFGRFSVAHENRPFRVAAGEAEVLAHGTVFEVSFAAGRTRVALIEGSVDVSYPAAAKETARLVQRLQPGEQIVVGNQPSVSAENLPQRRAAGVEAARYEPKPRMLQFDNTRLTEAVAEANRHSRTQLRLADPSIGELRISGAFRPGDAEALAESLAAAFNLQVERRPDDMLVLRSSPPRPIA